jgi:hypothetical protein
MIGSLPMQGVQDFGVTITQSVGALTVKALQTGKLVTLQIPAGTTSDGGGAALVSGTGEVPAHLRPSADISVPVVVTENGAKTVGKLVISSAGTLTYTSTAAGAVFTDDAVAGFDAHVVSYQIA